MVTLGVAVPKTEVGATGAASMNKVVVEALAVVEEVVVVGCKKYHGSGGLTDP